MPTAVAILQHWHDEGAPVFSLDFAAKSSGRLATGGADKKVRIWRVKTGADNEQQVEYRATINGHDKSVNAVRFSPSGTLLASAGDDGVINVYKLSQAPVSSAPAFGEDKDELPNKENWRMVAQLRGNSMDVFDLSWSPDSSFLISGSIDKHAMVFDVGRQVKVADLGPHNHNVQGVAWDSRNNLLCTLSSDRALRVFSRRKYNRFLNVTHMTSPPSKAPEEPAASDAPPSLAVAGAAPAPGEKKASTQQRLFADETVPTFFRRLAWSPEGSFLVVPCGQYKGAAGEGDKGEGEGGNSSGRLTSVAYVFARTDLDKPALCLPTFAQSSEQTAQDPAVVVRFNPHLFKHRAAANTDADSANTDGEAASNCFQLPYRVVFAVASLHTVAVYDTTRARPLAVVQGLHCAAITDLSWSASGNVLGISSHDGFCSMVHFNSEELGEKVPPAELPECMTEKFVKEQLAAFREKPKVSKQGQAGRGKVPAAAAATVPAAAATGTSPTAATTAGAADGAKCTPAVASASSLVDTSVASTAPHEAGTDAASPQPAADATNTTAVVDGHDGGDMNGSGEGEGESEQLTEEDAAFLEEDDGPSGLAEAMAAADKEPAPQLLSTRPAASSNTTKRRVHLMPLPTQPTVATAGPAGAAAAAAKPQKKRRVQLVQLP